MKLPLYGCDIGVDVRVVVLEVVEHSGPRSVVHELRTLIEEGGVVFICLNDEVSARAQSRRHREVSRHTADEKSWFQTGMLQYPSQDARGGRLAMRASHGEYPSAGQHMSREPLGT